MRENITTIKFTGIFTILFALLTYIVTLNMEIGFFQPNCRWISNDFALTVCGGSFTGFLVMMLCETQKYRSNKSTYENFLFTQTMYLYIALYLTSRNIDEYIMNKNEPIPNNLLDERILMIRSHAMAIQGIDYITFYKNNVLVTAHKDFCSNKLRKVDSIIGNGNYLKIAIIQTQLENLNKTYEKGTITSANEPVLRTLTALKKQIEPILEDISNYLETINQNCNGRYDWETQKMKIHENYISLFKAGKIEDFLKNAEVEL